MQVFICITWEIASISVSLLIPFYLFELLNRSFGCGPEDFCNVKSNRWDQSEFDKEVEFSGDKRTLSAYCRFLPLYLCILVTKWIIQSYSTIVDRQLLYLFRIQDFFF